LKRKVIKNDEEDEEHNEISLEVAKVSKAKWNENDRVNELLTGIKSGKNSALAALAKWLMESKKTYGRPAIDPRANQFKMKFYSEADLIKYGLRGTVPASSILKRSSADYSDSTRADSQPPNLEA
jgi:hypothetical protein